MGMALSDEGKLDVYAKPFVPEFLRNISHATPVYKYRLLQNPFEVDLQQYIRTFSGTDFLSGVSTQSASAPSSSVDVSTLRLTEKHYKSFFGSWVQEEFRAVNACQKGFDIFKASLNFVPTSSGDQLLTDFIAVLVVPGLAENSPYVRQGDIVDIRPVFFDKDGQPLAYMHMFNNGMMLNTTMLLPGWLGDSFDAVVIAVRRIDETIVVKLTVPYGSWHEVQQRLKTFAFNVHFPPRASWIESLTRALEVTGLDLEQNLVDSVSNGNASMGWTQRMLFPESEHGAVQHTLNSITVDFDPIDANMNWEQLRAINSIVSCNYGTVPFLIQGPPGTGKTKTMVEVALQLLKLSKLDHILVTAPSDPAADTLALRLKFHLKPGDMLRLNAPTRTFAEVGNELMPYCYVGDGNCFSIPPFKDVMAYRVVVTTCRDADYLVQARLTNRDLHTLESEMMRALHRTAAILPTKVHWQALLLDEAAQAIEPEALVPISVVSPPQHSADHIRAPLFIMAGDQQQLGPRTSSKAAQISTSLFERLLRRPLYADHPLARHRMGIGRTPVQALAKSMLPIIRPPFANLIRNYRSHPAILAIPNALFYHDTLTPEAANTDSLHSWSGWKGAWPVLFSQNHGADEIEKDGGGWYNNSEVQLALRHATSLLSSGLIVQRDICVMSPFSAQVRRLRLAFRASGFHDVNIGPTEAFQGLESRVVILCTTRSRTRFLEQDRERGFGIIAEPRRFNVAITRAMHGLLVLGSWHVLAVDPCWRAFLHFCLRNGLLEGCEVHGELLRETREAPIPILERALRAKERGLAVPRLALAGMLEDEMWLVGADGIDDEVGEQDDEDEDEDEVEDEDEEEDEDEDEDYDKDEDEDEDYDKDEDEFGNHKGSHDASIQSEHTPSHPPGHTSQPPFPAA